MTRRPRDKRLRGEGKWIVFPGSAPFPAEYSKGALPEGLNLKKNQIFFEVTKENKIDRIKKTSCTHYLDDLPEILEMIPDGVNKILFSPNREQILSKKWTVIESWKALPAILS